MECIVCARLNEALSTAFIPLSKLTSNDLEVLKRRLCHLITDEKVYNTGFICKIHKDEYLKWYTLRQKACCDPLNKHPNSLRQKSLKTISLNFCMSNPNIFLIPGKKLCISCYNSLISSKTESQIPTGELSSSKDDDFSNPVIEMEQLNKSCDALDMSPLKVNRYSGKRKVAYMHTKVKKLSKSMADKAAKVLSMQSIESNTQEEKDCPDCASMMKNLFDKFTEASFKEKVQILSIVPESWTIEKTSTYFKTTKYLVKKARKLKRTQGTLAVPEERKSVCLNSDTIKKVIDFYYDDNNSRVCPGKKDCISVPTENGRVLKQKRLILHNLKDLYIAFKEQHNTKIGLSKFCSLRPRECVTVNSKGVHSVCVCIYHQNVKLMLHALHMNDYIPLLRKLVCSIESETCMVHRCDKCPSTDILREELMLSEELEMQEDITYKQWVKTDGAELKTIIASVDEFIDTLITKLSALCVHHYFTKAQNMYFKKSKSELSGDTAIIVADFSENYTCIVQDEIQSCHWKKEQATVHPFLAYIKDIITDTVKSYSYCVISDHLIHDTTTFWNFQKVIVNHLITENPQITCIKYFSDGASAQYKNYKNFINLCHHEKDHGVKAEWHFFASCHGKGACDGIGGTIKRMATKASLQRPYADAILNAHDLYKFAEESVKGIKFFFIRKSEIDISRNFLEERYKMVSTIPGTRTNHSFIPINNTQLLIARVSGSSSTFIGTLSLKETKVLTLHTEEYVACVYGNNWWIGKVLECCEEYNDYKIMFMHPHGPSASYIWPEPSDVCWIPYEKILKILSTPMTTTGRTYNIEKEENDSVELLFKSLNE